MSQCEILDITDQREVEQLTSEAPVCRSHQWTMTSHLQVKDLTSEEELVPIRWCEIKERTE